MDGILNILKPPGMTSFDVVGYLRGIVRTKKIGHTGTLDPGAVGVLPICIGNATKAIEYITDTNKTYRAELLLGVTTDTEDSTGTLMEIRDVNVSEQQINEVVQSFVGKYNQVPPMYSAVKVDGKKLYELARKGVTIEREPREITIFSINKIGNPQKHRIIFDVECSKGTYIRTLCADIGTKLGCGGHMAFLIRTKAGIFDISSALTLEEVSILAASGKIADKLIKVDAVFGDYTQIMLDNVREKKFLNGVAVRVNSAAEEGMARVYSNEGRFLALGEVTTGLDGLVVKSKKMFMVD